MTCHNTMLSQTHVEGVGALESCGLGWRMDLGALGGEAYVSGGGQAMQTSAFVLKCLAKIGFISVQKVRSCVP
jgi:hypothetical protein